VVGSFDLIRRKPSEPERVKRWAENGMAAAERGAKLTGQLLAFSRAQRLEKKPVAMSNLVEGMRDLLERTLGEWSVSSWICPATARRCPIRPNSRWRF
jgi:C4-dicarboxylate-specific signal transduction histidine kinase